MVNKQEAINFVKDLYLQGYAECSAKTNENILETFRLFYNSIYKKNKTKLVEKTKKRLESMQAQIDHKNKGGFCCYIFMQSQFFIFLIHKIILIIIIIIYINLIK